MFEGVAAAGVAPPPVVLPRVAPANATEREAWLEQLSKGKHQGCGHMRLMVRVCAYARAVGPAPRPF